MQVPKAIENYLRVLNEDELDRVLTGQNWCARRNFDESGAHCLMGHAESINSYCDGFNEERFYALPDNPALAFDCFVAHYGFGKAIPAIKALAARIAAEKFPLRVPSAPAVEQLEEVGA